VLVLVLVFLLLFRRPPSRIEDEHEHRRELIEQLNRASLSMLLNTAEGNGKRHGRHRAKFFDDARGSASSAPPAWMHRSPKGSSCPSAFGPAKKCSRVS
jgi:hypothetical protein